jgi:hypothetical protein
MHLICASVLATCVSFLLGGCSLISNALDMENTATPANQDGFNRLASAAEEQGWRVVHGVAATDWPLTVFVTEEEKILFTENNNTRTIALTCDGPRLDDDDRCLTEVNKIWRVAFGHELVDD